MIIENIEIERKKKVLSLFCDYVDTERMRLEEVLKLIHLSLKDKRKIDSALDFAMIQHYGDSPGYQFYVCHPIRVAILCIEWMIEYKEAHIDLIVAALIHNVIEKNVLTEDQITRKFGPWISHTIVAITVDREAEKKEGWAESYYGNLHQLDEFGQILKAFDKFDNVYAIVLNPSDSVRKKYLAEIEKYVKPIISKLAPWHLVYFNHLLVATKELGYRPKEVFLES